MAGRTMNNPIRAFAWGAIALTVPLLSSCGGPAETPPLEGAQIGGPFTLINQDGVKTSDSDFAGKYRLVYFGYTYCPDVCPLDVQNLMKGYRLLEKDDAALAAKIQPIFITVDPARDDPKALKAFVSAFHPKLIGLTGSEAQIKAVADEYRVYYKKQTPAPGADGYLVDHARMALLMGPTGKPLAIISQDKDDKTIVAELERWTH